jgi:DNA-binding CsgD family transcriptional regulator
MKPEPVQALPIAVAIATADASRVATLRALVLKAGHVVADAANADVVLIERAGESTAFDIPVVVLGLPDNDAAGSLPADASVEQIDAALRAVAVGLIVRAHREPHPRGFEELRERTSHVLLTPRELDVLTAIGDGLSNKAMARRLGISLHTVKFHVESLFRKLGVRTRAEAVARGLERRVTETIDL